MSTETIDKIKDELATSVTEIKSFITEQKKADAARVQTIDELSAEVKKKFGTVSDVESKLDRVVSDQVESVKAVTLLQGHIDQLTKELKSLEIGGTKVDDLERKNALTYAEVAHAAKHEKRDPATAFNPEKVNVEQVQLAIKAMHKYIHLPHGMDKMSALTDQEWKAMTSFAFSGNSFVLAPQMSSRILSCLEDITDVSGMFSNMTISKGSVKFLTDNERLDIAGWACEASCFANNPKPHLEDGLGELEIKAETLRYSLCASRDLIEDADIDIESWMLGKVRDAFRRTLSQAFMLGDGNGKPQGILTVGAGLPICDTGAQTPAGTFTWQDVFMLKWNVAVQYHPGAAYMMNQNTLALALTLADANNRPLMIANPTEAGGMMMAGSPVRINTWMPNVATGTTPIAFGNWQAAYMTVNRRALGFQRDDYSAGFCLLYKFESRVGGAVICPNAARLMRIG